MLGTERYEEDEEETGVGVVISAHRSYTFLEESDPEEDAQRNDDSENDSFSGEEEEAGPSDALNEDYSINYGTV